MAPLISPGESARRAKGLLTRDVILQIGVPLGEMAQDPEPGRRGGVRRGREDICFREKGKKGRKQFEPMGNRKGKKKRKEVKKGAGVMIKKKKQEKTSQHEQEGEKYSR